MCMCQSNYSLPTRGSCSLRLLFRLLLGFTAFGRRAHCTKWHICPVLLLQAGKHSCSGCAAAAAAVLRSDYVIGTVVLCCNSAGTALVCYDWISALERGVGCAVGGLCVIGRRRLARQGERGKDYRRGHVSLHADTEFLLAHSEVHALSNTTWAQRGLGRVLFGHRTL